MTICILAFETGTIFWCLSLVSILVLMFPIIRTIDEMHIFGKYTSVLFAGGLSLFCFLGVLYLVVHNKPIQSIAGKDNSLLLIELTIYASLAICLYIVTVLGLIVKAIRTKKGNSGDV